MERFEHFNFNSRMDTGNNSVIKIEITTGRSLGSIFLVTYLPTILINIINQATNYFDSESFFDAIVTVNLTCMMVLSTLYISVSNSLPNTAYVKYVEIWLLGSLMYPFTIVIIHTFVQIYKKEEDLEIETKIINLRNDGEKFKNKSNWSKRITVQNKKKAEIGLIFAKYIIPILAIMFSLVYWAAGSWHAAMQDWDDEY